MRMVITTRAGLFEALAFPGTAHVSITAGDVEYKGILQSVQRESGDGRSFLVRLNISGKYVTVFWRAPKE